MPIKPENKALYPQEWKQIRAAILERAEHRCEGSPDFPDCRAPNGWYKHRTKPMYTRDPVIAERWASMTGATTKIVLTIAHLDHNPENCAPENLRAWCQRCHLHYDKPMHIENARATRKARRAAADLFEGQQ